MTPYETRRLSPTPTGQVSRRLISFLSHFFIVPGYPLLLRSRAVETRQVPLHDSAICNLSYIRMALWPSSRTQERLHSGAGF